MPDASATSVPPTPPIPLSALLAREDLGLRRIAGPSDPDTVIHWAHTSEMADPYPYLLGGELLLTAGVHIPEAAGSGTYFDDYVARIVAAGGAALGFGLAPVHDTVPRALVAACDTYGLPLLEVPPQTTFSGVARAVWQLMAQARLAELRRVTEAQQSLAAAAARPDPVAAVLRQLAQRVSGWAVLYGPEGAELARAGRPPEAGPVTALGALAGVVHPGGTQATGPQGPAPTPTPVPTPVPAPTPSSATDTVGGTHLAAYALGGGQGFVLGVAAPRRDPGDHTIASVAAVLLSLLTGEQQSGSGAARSAALVRLLLGAAPEDVAPLLGGDRWTVVHARPAADGPAPDAVAASALGAALGSALIDTGEGVVRVLIPGHREPTAQEGWICGVSAAVGPHEWASADGQAARALARARATRTPLVRHGERPALADLVPSADAEAHARALLAPIAATPALTETLRTWLSLHGSWDRTAVALSVHRNTVRQRIARCATLLEADLDDADVRMELWFALRDA
ncbi:PucR family transcriptional regulator [Streptomyces sp. NBC_01340]|uniref:PucR family transcriptional regulator n=1 Tax=unclassified Streptomyces TaxID=2593676 RepID=UPI00225B8D1D|nr:MULTISPECIES: PucR family transcriptional regulator [unclassified Streptomyces]MCX4454249.1 PucR family transcriptional regulator [Streptomyces sp. NBC_01719]MCX4493609.1 PucR family transcriptional regulator [Streptomyces sp. NBC_01728]WSI38722.1 PucR family transcriptional regulator [Streptomyces sp. NBC_01340]